MEGFLQMSLILGAAAVLYSAPIPRSSSPQQQQPVDDALQAYNEGLSSAGFLFGLLQDGSHDKENITFLIKETSCLKSAEKDEKCPFKEDGVVKNCTASPGSEGRRLEVSCQNIDPSDDSEDTQTSQPVKNHRVFQLLKSSKKKPGTNFLQFDHKSALDHHSAASCLACIFDFLNPKTNAGR